MDADADVEVEADAEDYEEAPRSTRRRPARRQGGKSRARSGQSAKARPSLARPGPTSLALHYALPLTLPMPSPAEGASGVSTGYGAPFLEAIELRALPVREYAAVEDIARSAWWTPSPTPGRLFRAVKATGATTLAEACQHAAVLDALMRAAIGLDE